MTIIRRAAQVVEDLKTLEVIDAAHVDFTKLGGEFEIRIYARRYEDTKRYFTRYAFEKEFAESVEIIEEADFIRVVLK